MSEERSQIDDPLVLKEKLREILIRGPLYRNFVYAGRACHYAYDRSVRRSRYGKLPQQLKMFCRHQKCNTETWWDVNIEEVSFSVDFIKERHLTCRNCGAEKQYYQFIWQERDGGSSIFVKVGQWPPLTIEPAPDLTVALGPEDSALYKKALVNFNFGYGIGAVGYFRRVLENKINALLDLIAEAARNENVESEYLREIDGVKKSRRIEERIDVASKILPAYLRPGGHNPLDKLYAPLSAGLHGESDDDCLTIFAEARFVFEYLFKNLTESNEEARKYVQQLSALHNVKTPQVDGPEPATPAELP